MISHLISHMASHLIPHNIPPHVLYNIQLPVPHHPRWNLNIFFTCKFEYFLNQQKIWCHVPHDIPPHAPWHPTSCPTWHPTSSSTISHLMSDMTVPLHVPHHPRWNLKVFLTYTIDYFLKPSKLNIFWTSKRHDIPRNDPHDISPHVPRHPTSCPIWHHTPCPTSPKAKSEYFLNLQIWIFS